MAEKQFVNGLSVKEKDGHMPDWIISRLLVNRLTLIEWLESRSEKWLEIDIKESKAGKFYCEVNTWGQDSAAKTKSNNAEVDEVTPY
jgi:hypothetical protein